jgi:hypothetical protein
MTSMLREACQRREVEIVVVNPDAGPVIERLKWIGIPEAQITTFTGSQCVAELVKSLRTEFALAFADRLREWRNDTTLPQLGSLTVTWGQSIEIPVRQQFTVTEVIQDQSKDEVELRLAEHIEPVAPMPAQFHELLDAIDGTKSVIAVMPDGRRMPCIGLWTADQAGGDQYRWISLTAAGRPIG